MRNFCRLAIAMIAASLAASSGALGAPSNGGVTILSAGFQPVTDAVNPKPAGQIRRARDPASGDDVVYNVSDPFGAWIKGKNPTTGVKWYATADPFTGNIVGSDANGHSWRYSQKSGLYTNLVTQKTCTQTSIREVCGN